MDNATKIQCCADVAARAEATVTDALSQDAYRQAARAQFAPSPDLPDEILDVLGELYWEERAFHPEKFR